MAKKIIENGVSYGTNRTSMNDNFTEIYAMQSYASLYLPTPEALTITAGTPISLGNVMVVRANNFEIIGGGLIYTGLVPIVVKVDGAISMISGTNNIIATVSFAKDGLFDADNTATEIDRKIGTGADVGAVPIAGTFSLVTGSRLDFYADVDVSATLTITKANFTIQALEVV